jgi:ABC-type transporter Mla subunit MlaD
MQTRRKGNTNSSLDYSFLFSKLEQYSRQNTIYRKAIAQIKEVANKIAAGDLTARIEQPDKYDQLSSTLSAVNNAFDFTDKFIRESEVSQKTTLIKQDEYRKEQLRELKDYYKTQLTCLKSEFKSGIY